MILNAFNPSVENLERSFLSADYAAGVTTIDVRNNNNFTASGAGSRIMIGELGNENTEIVTVSAVDANGTELTIGATLFPHNASDPVYVLRYDQIKFHRSTTTIDGTYTELVTVDIDVDNETLKTYYDDTTGLSSYFYKVSFYHSVSTVESSLSDPISGSGYTRRQVGALVNDFLTDINDLQQEYMTVPAIIGMLNEVNEDLIGQSRKPYRFLRASEPASISANDNTVPLPADMHKLDRVKYTFTDGTSITVSNKQIISIEELEYMDYDQTSVASAISNGIRYLAIDETTNELVIYPKPTTAQSNAIKFYYWATFDEIQTLSDTLQTPNMRIYKLFLLGKYYRIRAVKERSFLEISDRYFNDYQTEIVKLQRNQKLDAGSKMSFLPDTGSSAGLRR